jgi:hypothetical protein
MGARIHPIALLALAACQVGGTYTCQDDSQCLRAAETGLCQPATHHCSFADMQCMSGQRYDESAGGFGGQCVAPINLTIASDAQDYNIFTAAGSPSLAAVVIVTINTGVAVSASGTGSAALVTGSGWADGSSISIVNNGDIIGAGGNGGDPSGAGGAGGPAIALSWDVIITNANGYIYGGGGGGGGGGQGYYSDMVSTSYLPAGGGGGGGAGSVGGSGGKGGGAGGTQMGLCGAGSSPGTSGTATGGSGGAPCPNGFGAWGGMGGAGGGYGQAGSTGGTSNYFGPGAGGAAGDAITENGHTVTWVSGDSPPNVVGSVH